MMIFGGFHWGRGLALLLGCTGLIFQVSAAVTLQVGQNFAGSRFGRDSDATPADGNGAVGPAHFTEFVNGRFSVYTKTNGTRVATMTDIQFWNAAGVRFTSTVGVTDPRIIYDFYSGRWFASMVDFVVNSPRQRSNHFLLAVSEGNDPTGTWHGFSFGSDTNNVNFADFPTLGLDRDAVYISGDMFDRLGNPVGPTLTVVPMSGLLANPPTVSARKSLGRLSYTSRGDVLQPAVTIGAASTSERVIAVSDLGLDFQPHSTLVLSTITNSATAASLVSPADVVDVPSYTVPINPLQPDGTSNLDNGDARFASAARRVGDTLYVTHAVEVDHRAAIRWYKINAADNSLLESGTISDPTLDLFYPSIAANEAGTVVIACNGSSLDSFVSSYALVGEPVDGALRFGAATLLSSGRASYQNADLSGASRWGDYSATSLDPMDQNRFWTIQIVPASSSAWETRITELITTPSSPADPSVSIQPLSPNQVLLSWSTNAVGSQLQSSITLGTSAQWSAVPENSFLTNNLEAVVIPISTNTSFFRLTYPPATSAR